MAAVGLGLPLDCFAHSARVIEPPTCAPTVTVAYYLR